MTRWTVRSLVFTFTLVFSQAQALADQTNQNANDGVAAPTPERSQEDGPPVEGIGFVQAPLPTEPAHSGWGSLIKNTAGDFRALPRRRSTWVILGAGAGAALLAHPADDYVSSHIVGSSTAESVFVAGKWLGSTYVQAGAAVGVYLVGRYALPPAADGSRTNRLSHLGFDLIRAQILSQAVVHGIKHTVQRDRPTGDCCAFPSGHAASAFAAASVLERHFGYRGAWPTMVAASYVATSRLVDNRHFLSDVVFGAAVGIVSGWTVVGSHGRATMSLVPIPVPGGVFLAMTRVANQPH
jgi:hypothetical protein